MKRLCFLACMCFIACMGAIAQNKYSVKGIVVDQGTGEAVEGANVQLLLLPDSAFVKGAVVDSKGLFQLEEVEKKHYVAKLSFVGYTTKAIDIDLTTKSGKNIDLGYITFSADAKMLSETVVTASAAKV